MIPPLPPQTARDGTFLVRRVIHKKKTAWQEPNSSAFLSEPSLPNEIFHQYVDRRFLNLPDGPSVHHTIHSSCTRSQSILVLKHEGKYDFPHFIHISILNMAVVFEYRTAVEPMLIHVTVNRVWLLLRSNPEVSLGWVCNLQRLVYSTLHDTYQKQW